MARRSTPPAVTVTTPTPAPNGPARAPALSIPTPAPAHRAPAARPTILIPATPPPRKAVPRITPTAARAPRGVPAGRPTATPATTPAVGRHQIGRASCRER